MTKALFPLDLERVVTCDFETYYDKDYSLRSKHYNQSEYIRDPQFLVHCVGIKIGSGETKVYWYEDVEPALRAIDWSTHYLLCHHTNFDGLIMKEHYGIVPALYLDTLSMARALHNNQIREGNGLGFVAQFYGLGNKLPNVLGKMKGHRRIPEELMADSTAYTKQDVDLCYVIFRQMFEVYPERELRLIDLTCRFFCDPVLDVDLPRVQRELENEVAEKAAKIRACGMALAPEDELSDDHLSDILDNLQSAGKLAAILRGLGVEPPMKISPRTQLETYAFSLQDEDFLALGAHSDPRVRAVVEARLAVKSTIGETRARRFLKAGEGGAKLPVYLNYCAAHTTRWGGGNKLNLQNLKRGGELRKSILAPPGHVIAVCDSAQIEARVLAWLAGETELIEAFRVNADIYSRFASDVYGYEVNRKRWEMVDGAKVYPDKDKGHLGKVCVLGLGYGMGHLKLRGTLALGALGGPPIFISEEESQAIVNLYRRKNLRIKSLWWQLDDVLFRMVMKRLNNVRDDYTVFKEGVLEYDEQTIWLPNGLGLHYPELMGEYNDYRDRMENFSYRAGRAYTKIYGGLLTENIVQALARVIVGDQMLEISDKYRVVTMTHDEVVCCVPEGQANACVEDMLQVMSTPPAWAPDLPLSAEGGYAKEYSK